MAWWTQIFPVFLFKWFARRHCERVKIGDKTDWVIGRRDVLVKLKQ